MSDKVYDNHTIAINVGVLTSEEIRQYLISVHRSAESYIRSIESEYKGCRYYFHRPVTQSGVLSSKIFYWVDDPRVYHILTGKNIDGSDRVERTISPIQSYSMTDSWADDDAQYITKELGPLVEVPCYKSELGVEYDIYYDRAFTFAPQSGYSRSMLVCSRVDGGQMNNDTVNEIIKIFKRYFRGNVSTSLRDNKLWLDFGSVDACAITIMTKILSIGDVTIRTDFAPPLRRDSPKTRGSPSGSRRGREYAPRGYK